MIFIDKRKTVSRKKFEKTLKQALLTQVNEKVSGEICQVLNIDNCPMDAQTAIAFTQVAKAIKGDKTAFEMVFNSLEESEEKEQKGFKVEISVVE